MNTTDTDALDDLGRLIAEQTHEGAAHADPRLTTAILRQLREFPPQRVAQALWPGTLVLLDAAAIQDVVTRYTLLDQSIERIAHDTGQSQALTRVVLEHTGTPIRRPGALHTWTAAEIAEVERRHAAGEPLNQIAAALRLAPKLVGRKLDQLAELGRLSNR